MERLSVDDMKAIELDIMDEIDRVCAAHGVEYFLGYGTLLGAVRHGGFIPWDDDMDIIMMRDQYELLMDHFNEWRTSERFKLVSYRDKSSIYQFAKIVDTTTV
ncbi:LicD family protein, partial [uncultured Ellagibacter sp.]